MEKMRILSTLESMQNGEILRFYNPQKMVTWEIFKGEWYALKEGNFLVLFTESQLVNLAHYLLSCQPL